jgi:hypothetical protein
MADAQLPVCQERPHSSQGSASQPAKASKRAASTATTAQKARGPPFIGVGAVSEQNSTRKSELREFSHSQTHICTRSLRAFRQAGAASAEVQQQPQTLAWLLVDCNKRVSVPSTNLCSCLCGCALGPRPCRLEHEHYTQHLPRTSCLQPLL